MNALTLLLFWSLNWQIAPFHRLSERPVITPNTQSTFQDPVAHQTVHWEALHTFNPAAVVKDGKILVLYRAEDDSGAKQIGMHTSRLGLAESSDGLHFTRRPAPVFYPANDSQKDREWPGGVEDPRLTEGPNRTYYLTYTQWNRKTWNIGLASSQDLIHWTKHGPLFDGKYADLKYKSGAVVTRVVDGRLIAMKIRGRYWMYWGEGSIHLATSLDLLHWTPLTNRAGELISVLEKRPGKFDSSFPETGPPPVWTEQGIVMLYNGRNDASAGDKTLGPYAYSVGEALFAKDDPAHLVARTDQPVFRPELPFEKSGQYAAGTTFAEGLVFFKHQWFLYYGCADSFVGAAAAASQERSSR